MFAMLDGVIKTAVSRSHQCILKSGKSNHRNNLYCLVKNVEMKKENFAFKY